MPPSTARAGRVDHALTLLVLALLLSTAAAAAAPYHWLCDLATHFLVHVLVLSVLGLGLALLRRRWRSTLACLSLVAVHAVVVSQPYRAGVATAAAPPSLSITQYNLLTANRHHAKTAAYLGSTAPDIICLQEVSQRWQRDLLSALPGQTVVASEPRDDNYGIAMLQRSDGPVSVRGGQLRRTLEGEQLPLSVVVATLTVDARDVQLLTLHAHPPFSAEHDRKRGALLRSVARWVRAQDDPVVVTGDFNASPWSTQFRRLLASTGLVNSQARTGPVPTWKPFWGLLGGLVIDHVLHSPSLTTHTYAVGPDTGSDHRGVHVRLGFSEP